MMERVLYLDQQPDYLRAAVFEDKRLVEFMTEKTEDSDQTESLFLGRVQSVRKALNAAFVDIGEELHAFLPLDEGHQLQCGSLIIVQGAAKQSVDTKGLRVTDRINLPGKWLVLIPGGSDIRISKKIKSHEQREALMEISREICPEGCGLIVRTVSEHVTREQLSDEADSLYQRWLHICQTARASTKPCLLHRRERLDMRLIRDLKNLKTIVVNDKHGAEDLISAQRDGRIDAETDIRFFPEEHQLLFDAFAIEPQIDKALKKRVWLPCGGYLIIEHCEALTVIDVNSGKMTLGRDLEDTAFRVNLEAADEVARQLRLRDIGGIVVIDFIDMRCDDARRSVVDRMKQVVLSDRAQVTVEGMTKLGLLELTRKRMHTQLHKAMHTGCSYCSSTGAVLTNDEIARRALRAVRRLMISGQRGPFLIRCSPAAAQSLAAMHHHFEGHTVYAHAAAGRHVERFDIEQIGLQDTLPKDAVLLN